MAGKNRNPGSSNPTFRPKNAKARPFKGLLALILAILVAIAIVDFRWQQWPGWSSEVTDTNIVGQFGIYVGYYGLAYLGYAAYAVPCLLLWFSYMYFRGLGHRIGLRKYLLCIVLLTSLAVFGTMNQMDFELLLEPEANLLEYVVNNTLPNGWGGLIGYYIYGESLRTFFGMVGSLVVFSVLVIFCLIFLLIDNLFLEFSYLGSLNSEERRKRRMERKKAREEAKALAKTQKQAKEQQRLMAKKAARDKEEAKARQKSEETQKPESGSKSSSSDSAPPPPKKEKRRLGLFGGSSPKKEGKGQSAPFEPLVESDDFASGVDEFPDAPPPPPKKTEKKEEKAPSKNLNLKAGTSKDSSSTPGNLRIIAGEETKKAKVQPRTKQGNYHFPSLNLLAEPDSENRADDPEVHKETAELLVKTLDEFGVKVTMGEVHTGPVITRYDVYPAAGVRVERILNLDKNLALGLKAMSVRILAPVPGKGCVGIEVPNKDPQAVYIRDILESEAWVNTKAEIPIALGKEVSGRPLIADLTKMPHLLIAGSTGSGKTVCINSVVTSLLYHSSPEDLRFVMVDPKIVEMQVFNSLPHMLVPVVTEPKKVPNALKYLLNEMEKRYQIFAQVGVRNIAGYNGKMAKDKKERQEAEEKAAALDAELTPEERAASMAINVPRDPDTNDELPSKLPYIVFVVDELADLMMVAPADIETGIARLAQLARAAGIHLILATQRPSVNVITGVIKANLPSRISFKVASKVDSRTILDTMGADHLIGKGDMLFLPPGSGDLVRAQGAFVGDDEITQIVDFVKEKNGEPEFDEQFQRNIESGADDSSDSEDGDWDDELVPDAIEVIRNSKRASTSLLQRRLKIGYNRAARIMELLEAEGMVGPENGSSPREILIDID